MQEMLELLTKHRLERLFDSVVEEAPTTEASFAFGYAGKCDMKIRYFESSQSGCILSELVSARITRGYFSSKATNEGLDHGRRVRPVATERSHPGVGQ